MTHEVGGVLDNLAVLISHGHTIDVDLRLGLAGLGLGGTAVSKSSGLTVLLHELLITQTLVCTSRHDRTALVGEANDLVVNSLALPQLTVEEIVVLLTEQVRAVETTIVGVQNGTTGTGYATPVIDCNTLTTEEAIQEGALHTLENLGMRGTTRSTMQLTSDLNVVADLELTQVILQLLSILVLEELRCDRALCATLYALTSTARNGCRGLTCGNKLTANLMTIQNGDLVTNVQSLQINAGVSHALQGQEQTIGLLATQLNRTNISLSGVHVAARDVLAILINSQQAVLLTELHGQLQVGLKVDTDIALSVLVLLDADSAIETGCQNQSISIRVRTNILQSSNITAMSHYTSSFLKSKLVKKRISNCVNNWSNCYIRPIPTGIAEIVNQNYRNGYQSYENRNFKEKYGCDAHVINKIYHYILLLIP